MLVLAGWTGALVAVGALAAAFCAGYWLRAVDGWQRARQRRLATERGVDRWYADFTAAADRLVGQAMRDGGITPPWEDAAFVPARQVHTVVSLLDDDETRPEGWARPEPGSVGVTVVARKPCSDCGALAGDPHAPYCRRRARLVARRFAR